MHKKGYPLIDIFRVISAILVVAIHISPFEQINSTLDFYLTRGLGRIAVPFFFMTTAYFYYLHPTQDRFIKILKQYALIYLISIILYLPLNIYNQSFIGNQITIDIVKDILIDGTFYHLWYLPATMIGLILFEVLRKHLSKHSLFFITFCLYLIGLGGDSYYGLVNNIQFFHYFYDVIFQFCDYTRNGFFFTPLFIWIGFFLANNPLRFKKYISFILMMITLCLMILEITLLHHYQIPRHDAMSFSLPLVMFILFTYLLSFHGNRLILCKNLSLYVYIIHPWMIVISRVMMRFIHISQDNFMQFILVIVLSFLVAYLVILGRRVYDDYFTKSQLDRN